MVHSGGPFKKTSPKTSAAALAQHPRGKLGSGCTHMGPTQSRTPEQAEVDELIALNADYIASVQRGDVRRFEEILADDFLASNPDGSLVNKQQFLAQTARPVTITALTAHDVRVRMFGEVAIIHAQTSYVTQAGEQRNGRYTDIWAKRDGHWRAVAAHVTR
jgi:ketosteroid isomerase-like protein